MSAKWGGGGGGAPCLHPTTSGKLASYYDIKTLHADCNQNYTINPPPYPHIKAFRKPLKHTATLHIVSAALYQERVHYSPEARGEGLLVTAAVPQAISARVDGW